MTPSRSRTDAPPDILVVDDEPDLCTLYELTLLREGYRVDTAGDLQQARELLGRKTYDAVITDMRLPDGLGIDLVREAQRQQRPDRFMVITAYGSAESAVEALKAGAFDYLTKPVDLKQFRSAVAAALASTPAPVAAPSPAPPPAPSPSPSPSPSSSPAPSSAPSSLPASPVASPAGQEALARIVGASPIMVQVRQRIERVARSMAPVLIQGESGTGKELVARALHACSHRCAKPFVAVNCGAIPENLVEAEFFGVRKGAYTGASHDRPGYFQAAQGGTLFLDEIGDLPLSMQAKLLRAIQERQVRSLGATQEEPVDVRFVSATHKDLAQAVRAGQFRQDLFYRLNVIETRIPPLRERREDLPMLTSALLQRLCTEAGLPLVRLSDAASEWLREQPLPGNVRELENMLHRGLALCNGDTLEPDDLFEPGAGAAAVSASPAPRPTLGGPAGTATAASPTRALVAHLDQKEREFLAGLLQQHGQDLPSAAAHIGLTEAQLHFRLQRLGLLPPASP
jgi:two-component system, NtrC family, response regulator PilR